MANRKVHRHNDEVHLPNSDTTESLAAVNPDLADSLTALQEENSLLGSLFSFLALDRQGWKWTYLIPNPSKPFKAI